MIEKVIIYTSLLVAFIVFFLLYEKGFSFKNSLVMSLFSPLVGALFVVSGVFIATLIGALIIFGVIMYMFNRKKMTKFKSKNMQFKVYRI